MTSGLRTVGVMTFTQTELTDEQRAAVREFCSREFNDGIYEPEPERRWLFSFALAELVHETPDVDVEQASAFYDDAAVESEHEDAGPPPWTMAKLPESGNYDAVVVINDRLFGAEVGEGYIELSVISDASDWLASVRRDLIDQAVRFLRGQATLRFDQYGVSDARGAAFWDAACGLNPEDGDVLGLKIRPDEIEVDQ